MGWTQPLGQIFVRLNVASAAGLLVPAFVLIVASKVVDRLGDRRRQARRPAVPRPRQLRNLG